MKNILIIGAGCPSCTKLYENAVKAAEQANIQHKIEKITDINKFADYGVMLTPGLVIDNVTKSTGKVLSVDEIKELL